MRNIRALWGFTAAENLPFTFPISACDQRSRTLAESARIPTRDR
jgi:hypothetical protein